jgi:hypothetical protein
MSYRSAAVGVTIVLAGLTSVYGAARPTKDPQVIIANGKGSFPVGSVFRVLSPTGTSPISFPGGSPCVLGVIQVLDCVFTNASGSKWRSLSFAISPGNQIGPFSCLALAYFSTCSFNNHGTQVVFSGGAGLAPGADFLIVVLLWFPGTTFSATATKANSSRTALEPSPRSFPAPGSEPAAAVTVFLQGHAAFMDWPRPRTGEAARA